MLQEQFRSSMVWWRGGYHQRWYFQKASKKVKLLKPFRHFYKVVIVCNKVCHFNANQEPLRINWIEQLNRESTFDFCPNAISLSTHHSIQLMPATISSCYQRVFQFKVNRTTDSLIKRLKWGALTLYFTAALQLIFESLKWVISV